METANPMAEPVIDTKERTLSLTQGILLLFAAFGYATALFGVDHNCYPLPFFLGNTTLFLLTLVCGLLCGGKLNVHAIVSLLLGIVAGVCPWINGLQPLPTFVYVQMLVLAYAFLTLSLFGNHNRALSGGLLLLDAIKATFVYPFASFPALFRTLFRPSQKGERARKTALYVLLGVVIALVLGVIAVSLLSYDPAFRAIFTFQFEWNDVPLTIMKLILAIPLAALLNGSFVSSKAHKLEKMSSPESAAAVSVRVKVIPAVILMIPVAALLAIYGIFFFTQWETYMSAFSGVLPESFTAAEYARSGFFELCGVAAINAALGVVMELFEKRTGMASELLRRIANSLLALATLVLIATALSKMILYVQRFDLTVLRLTVSVLLVLIAIGFFTALVAQWIRCVRVTPVLVVLVAALLLALPFANVHGRIAAYNVDAYLARAEQGIADNQIDVAYLTYDLGSAAVPDAVRLLASGRLNAEDERELKASLRDRLNMLQAASGAWESSLADQRALKILLGCDLSE